MYPSQLSSQFAEHRRRQFVAEASDARLAKAARAATPRVRKQRRRFASTLFKPVFDVSTVRPPATA